MRLAPLVEHREHDAAEPGLLVVEDTVRREVDDSIPREAAGSWPWPGWHRSRWPSSRRSRRSRRRRWRRLPVASRPAVERSLQDRPSRATDGRPAAPRATVARAVATQARVVRLEDRIRKHRDRSRRPARDAWSRRRSAASTEAEGRPDDLVFDQHRHCGRRCRPGMGSAANGRCWSAPSATTRIRLPFIVVGDRAEQDPAEALRLLPVPRHPPARFGLGDPVRSRSLAAVRSAARTRAAPAPSISA